MELLKVMIVDDEALARNFVKACIDWQTMGLEIVGEAGSGIEALELMEEVDIDILFTDIQMPYMDGLTLSKAVLSKNPNIKIVILTAHDEFEYAQESVKLGVSDFLLKPINRNEAINVVESIKRKIEDEQNHMMEFDRLKKELEENFSYLKEKLLMELLEKGSVNKSVINKLSYYYGGKSPESVQVELIESTYKALEDDLDEEKNLFLRLQTIQIIKKFFEGQETIETFFDNNHRIVIISINRLTNLVSKSEQLKLILQSKLRCNVAIGIGNCYVNLEQMDISYKEALDALKLSIFSIDNPVIYYDEDVNLEKKETSFHHYAWDDFSFYIKAGLAEKAVEMIREIFYDMSQHSGMTLDKVRINSVNIVNKILDAVMEIGLDYEDIFEDKEMPYKQLMDAESKVEFEKVIIDMIGEFSQNIRKKRTTKGKELIREIEAYIEEHVADQSMSLATIAEHFFMNSSYLSRVFKRETGHTYTEYIIKVRMEKAVQLLNETDMKAYEVSDAIGIGDPYYFSNLFKKYTGKSVSTYRNLT